MNHITCWNSMHRHKRPVIQRSEYTEFYEEAMKYCKYLDSAKPNKYVTNHNTCTETKITKLAFEKATGKEKFWNSDDEYFFGWARIMPAEIIEEDLSMPPKEIPNPKIRAFNNFNSYDEDDMAHTNKEKPFIIPYDSHGLAPGNRKDTYSYKEKGSGIDIVCKISHEMAEPGLKEWVLAPSAELDQVGPYPCGTKNSNFIVVWQSKVSG